MPTPGMNHRQSDSICKTLVDTGLAGRKMGPREANHTVRRVVIRQHDFPECYSLMPGAPTSEPAAWYPVRAASESVRFAGRGRR